MIFLEIGLLLPAALTQQAANLPELRASLQLTLNLKDGLCMNIGLQDGAVGTKTRVVANSQGHGHATAAEKRAIQV
jgi:hypothetical protein